MSGYSRGKLEARQTLFKCWQTQSLPYYFPPYYTLPLLHTTKSTPPWYYFIPSSLPYITPPLTHGSLTTSNSAIILGPPLKFSKIFISLFIFFFFTGWADTIFNTRLNHSPHTHTQCCAKPTINKRSLEIYYEDMPCRSMHTIQSASSANKEVITRHTGNRYTYYHNTSRLMETCPMSTSNIQYSSRTRKHYSNRGPPWDFDRALYSQFVGVKA